VLNRGFSGYNTRHALDIAPAIFDKKHIPQTNTACNSNTLFCTVWFGANDAAVPGNHRQHVPLEEYRRNIVQLLRMIRQELSSATTTATTSTDDNAVVPIIVLTPPPVHAQSWLDYCKTNFPDESDGVQSSNRTNESARMYGAQVLDLVEELTRSSSSSSSSEISTMSDLYVLDTFALLSGDAKDDAEYKKYLSDGLHLSALGNEVVFEGLMKLIRTDLKHVSPDDDGGVPLEGALWDTLC